jgi:hypothetical protein
MCAWNSFSMCCPKYPRISTDEFDECFSAAWGEDPGIALRLVFQLGNCMREQDGRKLDRINFLRVLMVVWKVEPEMLLLNAREIVMQGCYKMLLELLRGELHPGSFKVNLNAADRHKIHHKRIQQGHVKVERRKEKEACQVALKYTFADTEENELLELYLPNADLLWESRCLDLCANCTVKKGSGDPKTLGSGCPMRSGTPSTSLFAGASNSCKLLPRRGGLQEGAPWLREWQI